ncbi:MAG: ferritin [Polyangia bacterium]|jgi:ferritin|nr:ferritin [Polyangia bacterium]
MLSGKMQEALNSQINAELGSAYIYMAMAAYFESMDVPGFANWMEVQSKEVLSHAQLLYRYVYERDGRVELSAIEGPPKEWKSLLDAFGEAYKHEQYISKRIHDLVDLARQEKDAATENFLQWFVKEQVEEEASAKAIIQQLKLVGDFGPGILMLDREMATRVFTPPVVG